MKTTALALIIVATVCCAAWQRRQLATLHRTEKALTAESVAIGAAVREQADETKPVAPDESSVAGLPDEEFAQFTRTVLAMRREFEDDRFYKLADVSSDNWKVPPALCDPLSRLTADQLRSLLEEVSDGSPIKYDYREPTGNLLALAMRTNPAATVKLIYQIGDKNPEANLKGGASMAFWHWFQQDPAGLLQWARGAGTPEDFDGMCAIWADAAETLRAPSMENVQRFLAHKGYYADSAASQLAAQLPSAELRLQFFRSLHAASGGTLNVEGYVGPLVANISFAELAHLADSVPPFTPTTAFTGNPFKPGQPAGSLRCEIAIHTRDGTAETRWQWLTQRPEDRPAEKLLERLVYEWCEHDFPDTANWAKTLPSGPEQETVRKTIAYFLSYRGAKDLAREWDAG